VFFGLVAPVAAAGQVRTEMSLTGVTVGITYEAALGEDDAANRAVATPANDRARVRVGRLDSTGQVKVGDVTLGGVGAGARAAQPAEPQATPQTPAPQAGPQTYDVWLEAASGGWALSFARVTDPATEVGRVPLTRQPSSAAPRFIASLVPVGGTKGRLIVRWGRSEGSSDVTVSAAGGRGLLQAAAAAQRSGQAARGRQGQPAGTPAPPRLTNRAHDADNSAGGRRLILSQRNESALVFPENRRVSVTFQRSAAPGEPAAASAPVGAGAAAAARGRGLGVDGPDFARLASTPDKAVVTHTQGPVPRLVIDAPLRFGATTIPIGNLGKDFPGSYGLWLKRAGTAWRLVFNNEPDVWGTQHNAKTDAAEIPLQHTEGGDATRPFAVAFVPTGADRGRLIIMWGPHDWSADFTIG
jgi:hypothetical protein